MKNNLKIFLLALFLYSCLETKKEEKIKLSLMETHFNNTSHAKRIEKSVITREFLASIEALKIYTFDPGSTFNQSIVLNKKQDLIQSGVISNDKDLAGEIITILKGPIPNLPKFFFVIFAFLKAFEYLTNLPANKIFSSNFEFSTNLEKENHLRKQFIADFAKVVEKGLEGIINSGANIINVKNILKNINSEIVLFDDNDLIKIDREKLKKAFLELIQSLKKVIIKEIMTPSINYRNRIVIKSASIKEKIKSLKESFISLDSKLIQAKAEINDNKNINLRNTIAQYLALMEFISLSSAKFDPDFIINEMLEILRKIKFDLTSEESKVYNELIRFIENEGDHKGLNKDGKPTLKLALRACNKTFRNYFDEISNLLQSVSLPATQ